MNITSNINRRGLLASGLACGAAALGGASWPAAAATGNPPVLIELFTSQGCSSCPPADEFMAELVNRPGIIGVSMNVDYWNYLGWQDTLSQPLFSRRQKDYAARRGELPIDVTGIVSNHDTLKASFAHWNLPWFHVPVTAATKAGAEARLLEIVAETGSELIVLARYMQVLSQDACRRLEGRIINIHHSFLPGFKGAQPYHQAHTRGVKVIGATAHYVTADLDEGPIISQVTESIDHSFTPDDMVETGRHIEGIALLRAVKAHAEHRVFQNSGRTVVFAR